MSRLALLMAATGARKMLQDDSMIPLGSTTALVCEASDAGDNMALVADGLSGDTDWPHGHLKPIVTVGETDPNTGVTITGVPDGMGPYLLDEDTVRLVFQSESYGPLTAYETYTYTVNDGVKFTGSHLYGVDMDRSKLGEFMSNDVPASDMIKQAVNMIETVYNANGELVVKRNPDGPTTTGAFDSAVDVAGNYVLEAMPTEADWHYMSMCSSHMAPKHQWGEGMGFVDDVYLTVEEWTNYDPNATAFIGLPMHAVDVATKTAYTMGAVGFGGYEKVVEFSCGEGNTAYVCLSVSGYNGAHGVDPSIHRNEIMEPRSDGMPWVDPNDIVPARIYIGIKGLDASGEPADDFLSRNGLAFGKVYGFAVPDNTTAVRDEFHKTAAKGDVVDGAFLAIDWMWNGTADDFQTDYAWEFQEPPAANASMSYWTAMGPHEGGKKMEHNAEDPRGNSRFIQGSTAGYMGTYLMDLSGLSAPATGKAEGALAALPVSIPTVYTVVQGETSIVDQIELGGKGITADGGNQTVMNDGDTVHETFEDIDGLYWFAASDGDYLIIQEDGGNIFGERMFISQLTEGTEPLTYYFIAQAGGENNTRMLAEVGVPAGTWGEARSSEFSGAVDFSPFLAMQNGTYVVPADDTTGLVRAAAQLVPINEKTLGIGLQMHGLYSGVIDDLGADRGGAVYGYVPNIPVA